MANRPTIDPENGEQLSNWENEGGALAKHHQNLDDAKGEMADTVNDGQSRTAARPSKKPLPEQGS